MAVVKMFWISAPSLTPKIFTMARKMTTTMPVRLAVLTPISMLPSTMGPTASAGTWAMCHSQWVVETDGKEDAEKLAEGHADGGDGPGLDDQKERPAVEKAPQRPQRLAQVDVLAAGLGHHGRQLAVAERADHGQDGRHHPRAQKERRGVGAAGNVGIDDEDAGADHGADDDRRGAEEAKALHQPGSVGRGAV